MQKKAASFIGGRLLHSLEGEFRGSNHKHGYDVVAAIDNDDLVVHHEIPKAY
jgi:hypothetical protein